MYIKDNNWDSRSKRNVVISKPEDDRETFNFYKFFVLIIINY